MKAMRRGRKAINENLGDDKAILDIYSKAIFSAKMSFSTKIIDYMMIGKTIVAYGPLEVNSI